MVSNSTHLHDASWIRQGYLRTPCGLRLSFQRYVRSQDGRVPQPLPSSLGALPSAWGEDGALLIPLAPNEAFWIGLQPDESMETICVTLSAISQTMQSALMQSTVDASGGRISGYLDSTGQLLSFAREVEGQYGSNGCSSLECSIEGISNQHQMTCNFPIRLVRPFEFTNESGMPAPRPVDPDAGYRGYLLP